MSADLTVDGLRRCVRARRRRQHARPRRHSRSRSSARSRCRPASGRPTTSSPTSRASRAATSSTATRGSWRWSATTRRSPRWAKRRREMHGPFAFVAWLGVHACAARGLPRPRGSVAVVDVGLLHKSRGVGADRPARRRADRLDRARPHAVPELAPVGIDRADRTPRLNGATAWPRASRTTRSSATPRRSRSSTRRVRSTGGACPRVDSGACFAALLGDPRARPVAVAAEGRGRPDASGATCPRRSCSRPSTRRRPAPWSSPTSCRPAKSTRRSSASSKVAPASVEMELELIVRFDYGSVPPWVQSTGDGLTMVAGSDALRFHSPVPLAGRDDLATTAEFTIGEGHVRSFSLAWYSALAAPPTPLDAPAARMRTLRYWREWVERCTYEGEWRDEVVAVADHGEGAVVLADRRGDRGGHHVAARADRRRPQLGLPLLVAPRRVAHAAVAPAHRLHRGGRGVAAVVAARGRRTSRRLPDHVRRRRRAPAQPRWSSTGSPATKARSRCASATRRAGSSSSTCSARCSTRAGPRCRPTSPRTAATCPRTIRCPGSCCRRCSQHLEKVWNEPDDGIWEIRGPAAPLHALQGDGVGGVRPRDPHRGAPRLGPPPVDRWAQLRDEVHAQVCEKGFNAEKNCFVQYYGSDQLDASLLMLARVGFLPPTDPAHHRHGRGDPARARGRRVRVALPHVTTATRSTASRPVRARS